jgi:ATP-binding cassette ChvD family protein
MTPGSPVIFAVSAMTLSKVALPPAFRVVQTQFDLERCNQDAYLDGLRRSRSRIRSAWTRAKKDRNINKMASYQYIYVMKGLNKTFPGGKQVLKDIWLSFLPGAKIGVLGLNGAGKSTLLKVMAGEDDSFTGEAWAANDVKVGFLKQEPHLNEAKDVLGNVMEGAGEMAANLARFEEVSNAFSDPDADMDKLIAEQAELQEKIDAGNGWDLGRTVEIAMDALRCPPSDSPVDKLSGGEKRRVALCRLLLSKPDMLLLDEPTNHLDAESVSWLERHLAEFPGTVVAVTHDRYFLDNVAGWILELDRGAGIPWEGNYSSWLKQKDKRLELEEKTADARRRTMQRELEWMGTSPSARRSKSKARIAAYNQMVEEDNQQTLDKAQIVIPAGPRLGDHVIEADKISKGFGDRLLIDNLSFKLPPGGIVGVIGPNGAGKTTLFKMITGLDKPDTGTFSVGPTVKLGYVDQSRETLDPNKTVWEELSGGLDIIKLGSREISSRAYCGSFNFKGADQQKKVGQLSGGERNRVNLAKMLKSGANVLLLDEPTNDLDVDTLRALEEALVDYAGCAVVISHDRWFLDRIATHMLAFEGDSHVEWFEGNYQDYELDRHRRMGTDADQPHRIKYKPLVRN